MSPIMQIALRRIRRDLGKLVFFVIGVFFSVLMIAFFLFFEIQTQTVTNSAYTGLPFTDFLGRVRSYMNIAVAFLIFVTLLTVRTYCGMRNRENAETLAVLTSVGATGRQRRSLILTEMLVLYLPPIVFGVCVGGIAGVMAGDLFLGTQTASERSDALYLILGAGIIAAGMLLVLLCYVLPDMLPKKRAVISSVKRQNPKASVEHHAYRQSKTFKNQILLRRLAKKSVDYHGKIYNGIALSFASSAFYAVLTILLFGYIGNTDVVLDTNPYDAIDTTAAVLEATEHILVFIGVCFPVLTVTGLLQSVFMARTQLAARKKTAHVYLSIGMPDSEIRKMIRAELRSVLLRAFVYLFLGALIANACFMAVM